MSMHEEHERDCAIENVADSSTMAPTCGARDGVVSVAPVPIENDPAVPVDDRGDASSSEPEGDNIDLAGIMGSSLLDVAEQLRALPALADYYREVRMRVVDARGRETMLLCVKESAWSDDGRGEGFYLRLAHADEKPQAVIDGANDLYFVKRPARTPEPGHGVFRAPGGHGAPGGRELCLAFIEESDHDTVDDPMAIDEVCTLRFGGRWRPRTMRRRLDTEPVHVDYGICDTVVPARLLHPLRDLALRVDARGQLELVQRGVVVAKFFLPDAAPADWPPALAHAAVALVDDCEDLLLRAEPGALASIDFTMRSLGPDIVPEVGPRPLDLHVLERFPNLAVIDLECSVAPSECNELHPQGEHALPESASDYLARIDAVVCDRLEMLAFAVDVDGDDVYALPWKAPVGPMES
jgi:hypothetical protein